MLWALSRSFQSEYAKQTWAFMLKPTHAPTCGSCRLVWYVSCVLLSVWLLNVLWTSAGRLSVIPPVPGWAARSVPSSGRCQHTEVKETGLKPLLLHARRVRGWGWEHQRAEQSLETWRSVSVAAGDRVGRGPPYKPRRTPRGLPALWRYPRGAERSRGLWLTEEVVKPHRVSRSLITPLN